MNNIFSALIHRRDAGVIREFVLWCILCFNILLTMIAVIMAGTKASWIMLLLFTIVLVVLLAFRLTVIALLYSVGVFYLIMPIIHYICYRSGNSVISLILFMLLILLSLAALICSFVHNFSPFNLDKLVMVLLMIDSGFLVIVQILLYVGRNSIYGFFRMLMGADSTFQGYWMGIISFWILLIVLILYEVFFVLGLIDNSWNKIARKPENFRESKNRRASAGLQGIRGECAGQIFYINKNNNLIIGTDRGATLTLSDARVSRWHCAVRYNPGQGENGFYEVYDRSTNGVYVNGRDRMPQNAWIRLQKGSIIGIGGVQHQFRLL